ncbi:hypothetical protein [Caulobacter sp. 17J65-9]|uniref:hypothetical protein n=1 Tax=Caulobacter sp. 17J65-9 TaxID=2709382 RepID=UPI0013CD6B30|nr:hypothetical protein [Caulobacter sp. 17J65-9]NEX94821.1 hypothetical protein [Caulobacter sp. 17J65-9]
MAAAILALGFATAADAQTPSAPAWLKPKFGASIPEVAAAVPGTVPTTKAPGLQLKDARLDTSEGVTLFIFENDALTQTLTFFRSGDDVTVSASLSEIYGPGECKTTEQPGFRGARCHWTTNDGRLDLNYLRAGNKLVGFTLERRPAAPAQTSQPVNPSP